MTTSSKLRSGQAMVEAVIAVAFISALLLGGIRLAQALMGKILVEHAAMRVARARAVGLNSFMCRKIARIAVLPVSGERLQPASDDSARADGSETALARMYMRTPNSAYADRLLRYELWDKLNVVPGNGGASAVELERDDFNLRGEAEVDTTPIYLSGGGR